MKDNTRSIALFYLIFKYLNKKGIKWRDLTKYFDKFNKFDMALNKIISNYLKDSLFESNSDIISKLKKQADLVSKSLEKRGIKSITYDNFQKYELLSRIKNAYWLFIKGDEGLLNGPHGSVVSVVGSRKTTKDYFNSIVESIPEKTIVSGLAKGADTFAHEWAMANNLPIIIFPGIDINERPKDARKNEIWSYALKNGVIVSDIIPGSKSFDKSVFLKRNKWMAQIVNETYVVYFNGRSGTLGQALEVVKNGGKVFMTKEVYNLNLNYLKSHKAFSSIINSIVILKDETHVRA